MTSSSRIITRRSAKLSPLVQILGRRDGDKPTYVQFGWDVPPANTRSMPFRQHGLDRLRRQALTPTTPGNPELGQRRRA